MKQQEIIDADKLVGKLDMNYDWELSEYESHPKYPIISIQSPAQIEQRAVKFMEDGLAKIK